MNFLNASAIRKFSAGHVVEKTNNTDDWWKTCHGSVEGDEGI